MKKIISDFSISARTSCIKNVQKQLFDDFQIMPVLEKPQSGDLILARCLQPKGAYSFIEYGLDNKYQLTVNDIVLTVLGNRASSTHIYGIVPDVPLKEGDIVDLISGAGMIGKAVYIPSRFGGETTRLEIIGFVSRNGREACNLKDLAQSITVSENVSVTDVRYVFIGGSSAQVGKTTFACNLTRTVRQLYPDMTISVLKATGTGSAKYHDLYKNAGADYTLDYVDFGYPSTYGLEKDIFRSVLEKMVSKSAERSDIIIVELGGDLYEANCPATVRFASQLNSHFIFVANDAMGATEGLRLLKSQNIEKVIFSSFRQNLYSLSKRLNIPMSMTIDMDVNSEMQSLVKSII